MMEKQFGEFLAGEGYIRIPSNLPEFTIYFRMENNYVNVLHVIDYQKNLYISDDQYLHVKDKIRELFREKGILTIHILSLIICSDVQRAKQLCGEDTQCWIIDPDERRLMVYENQVSDFYGMKDRLDYFLSHADAEYADEADTEKEALSTKGIKRKIQIPYVTLLLVLSNIFIFVICTFTGTLVYNKGAFGALDVIEGKQYYRILTSMFLHGDINHLVSNMVVLYYLGESVEHYFGRLRYIILYLAAGVSGAMLSMCYELLTGSYISSVGASGAIFGIIGAVFVLVVVHKGHWEQISMGRLLFMLAYSLYSGLAATNVNNAAHIGGFFGGALITYVLWILQKMKSNRNGDSYEN